MTGPSGSSGQIQKGPVTQHHMASEMALGAAANLTQAQSTKGVSPLQRSVQLPPSTGRDGLKNMLG